MFAFTKLMQAMVASGSVSDPQFYLTTLLLNTSSTNGAQNNTFLDSSTNNFTITRNGNTTQGTFTPFSQTGWSNFFNGSGDYLTLAPGSAFAFGTGDFTIEQWFYAPSTLPTYAYLLDARNSGQTSSWATGFNLNNTGSGQFTFFDGVAGAAYNESSVSYKPAAWNHCVVVRSGTTFSMFMNGVRVYTTTNSTNFSTSPTLSYIGRGQATGSEFYFPGYMSGIRVVKGTAVYSPSSTTLTVPTAPLTAITNTAVLTCQSNRFIDNSSNAFAITANGTPSVQAFSPFAPTAAYDTAVVGGSGYFDGSGDYLQAPNNAAFQFSGAFTIEMWVYPTQVTSRADLVTTPTSPASASGIYFFINSSAAPFFGSGAASFITSSKTVSPNTWTHLALTRDGSNVATIWVNGVSGGTATVTQNFSDGNLYVGTENALANYFQGYMSSIRVVKGTAIYTSTFTPPTAPLTAITNTSLLLSCTNAGIYDSASKNVLETVGNAQVSTTQSKWGTTSMAFDGTGDYLTIPNGPIVAIGSGDFTIECWWYPTDLSASSNVWCLGDSRSANNGLLLYWSSGSGKLILYSNGAALITSSINTTTNAWYYINVVRSGSGSNNLTLYINGSSAGTATNTTSFTGVAANGFAVCAEYAGSFGAGKASYFDDVRITKGYARSSTTPTAAFGTQ